MEGKRDDRMYKLIEPEKNFRRKLVIIAVIIKVD